jgi:predicted DNA-binding protein YlxM (UPF0122 family)
MVLDIEKILRERDISKRDFAEKLGIAPQNVNRTIKRLSENLSEIDNILKLLGTSLKAEAADGATPASLEASQQRTIENLSETIKNLTSKHE